MKVLREGVIQRFLTLSTIIILVTTPLLAQTKITAPSNRYSVQDDVRLGQEAAAEVNRQMPLLPRNSDPAVYVSRVGQRLVRAIPSEFQHPQFRYQFSVVNASDINAFALPGGPLYFNRGMIEAASNEGEMAGVMAHEISHVALRHGTAQASRAQRFQLGALAGAILGSIVGGGWGGLIQQGTQTGLGVYFLRYSREYETQADILGAQIMARAGYDPRDLANMFRTIEAQGRRAPEWLSSHPNPGNRYERINQEGAMLRVVNPTRQTAEFTRIQAQLRQMPPAPTTAEIARARQRLEASPAAANPQNVALARDGIQLPSSRMRNYTGSEVFRAQVPENWYELRGNNAVTFAPDRAFGSVQDQLIITHGAQLGVIPSQSRDLRLASDRFLASVLQTNPHLRRQGAYRRSTIDRQPALISVLSGRSDITGQTEVVNVHTRLLESGELFYLITVAPGADQRRYRNAFNAMLRSITISDRVTAR